MLICGIIPPQYDKNGQKQGDFGTYTPCNRPQNIAILHPQMHPSSTHFVL